MVNTRESTQKSTIKSENNDKKLKLLKLQNKIARLSKNNNSSNPKDTNNLLITTRNKVAKTKDFIPIAEETNAENSDNQENKNSPDSSSTSFLSTETTINNNDQTFGDPDNESGDPEITSQIKVLGNDSSVDLIEKSGSVASEVTKTKDIGKKLPTPTMAGPTETEKYDTMVDLLNKIGQLVLAREDNKNNNNNGSGSNVNLGKLTSSEYEKYGMKISELEAVETHPWLMYCKSHDSKMVDIPLKISKIEDVYIRKAILTYIRQSETKLTLYQKLLLQCIEKEPVGVRFNSGSSFLVRLLTYLDNENKAGSVNENAFTLEVNKIDRQMHNEEMQEIRQQLQSSSQQFSKSSFSAKASENRRIDKQHESFKLKYPIYKGYCLDWNIGGHCKRGADKCSYKHECLHCINNGGGNCGKQARVCEQSTVA